MKQIKILFILLVFVLSCKKEQPTQVVRKETMSVTKSKPYKQKNKDFNFCQKLEKESLEKELCILSAFLHKKGIKVSDKLFKDRNKKLLNVDLDTLSREYINVTSDGYNISSYENILNTYYESIYYNPNTTEPLFTDTEVIDRLMKGEDPEAIKLIAFNDIFYNDNREYTSFFLKDTDSAFKLVLELDYLRNFEIIKHVVLNLNPYNLDSFELDNILYHNNKKIKKEFLNYIYVIRGVEFIGEIKSSLLKKNNTSIEQESIDYLDYLIKNSESFKGVVVDNDGYTNFRKSKSTDSIILGRIDMGSLVNIIKVESNWVKISYNKTEGYIHKSRIIF